MKKSIIMCLLIFLISCKKSELIEPINNPKRVFSLDSLQITKVIKKNSKPAKVVKKSSRKKRYIIF
jgi:hypothetical protein